MAGELDEQSEAIGGLRVGVANLERALIEHSRRDEEYRRERDRKADVFHAETLKALSDLQVIAKTQVAQAATLEEHDERLDGHDKKHERQKGFIAAMSIVGGGIVTVATLAIQWLTSGPNGQ
jgi:hypothetical protein